MIDIVFQFWWRCRFPVGFSIVGEAFNSIGPFGCDWTRLSFLCFFQRMALLQLKFYLNCIAVEPTVFCVCNAWLWGQLSFQMHVSITWKVVGSVYSCGRRCFLNVIENVDPRWFCRVSRYIFNSILNATDRSWDSSPVSQIEFDCISS